MVLTSVKRRVRREVTIYLGVLPLFFGGLWCPFAISGLLPNYRVPAIAATSVGCATLLIFRIAVDSPALLAKRMLGAFAHGLATGYCAYAVAWANLLNSWYEYATAFFLYLLMLWGITRLVDLRVDEWKE
jgi:hypothetical protein